MHAWLSSKSLTCTSNLKKNQNTYSFLKMSPILFQLTSYTSKITDTTIDRIFSFKCLSLIFTPMHSSSSSSRIFYSTRKKAKNQFYIHCSSSTLLTLCKLLIHPILEFTAVIWDSTSHTNPSLLLIYYLISQRKKRAM